MAKADSENVMLPVVKRDKAWLKNKTKVSEYTAMGASTVRAPTISFSRSFMSALILLFAAVLRKSLISKMLADATDTTVKQGIRMLEMEVKGLIKDNPIKANGTRQ